jgi:hypothetical protein
MVKRTPLEREMREILETTTTSTQAVAAECETEQVPQRYYFVADNHNRV